MIDVDVNDCCDDSSLTHIRLCAFLYVDVQWVLVVVDFAFYAFFFFDF